jgi:AcrR family transcriptional regulator
LIEVQEGRLGIQERKAREKEWKRKNIMDAAKKEFLEQGLEGSTMDSIAARAEISKGAIYLQFKDKEDLMMAILEDSFGNLRDRVAENISSQALGLAQLREMFNAYIAFCNQNKEDFFFTHFADHLLGSIKKDVSDTNPLFNLLGDMVSLVEQNLRAGIDQGVVRKDLDPKKTAVIIIQMVSSFFQRLSKAGAEIEKFHGYSQQDLITSTFEFFVCSIKEKREE